jgi:hypothetical protein
MLNSLALLTVAMIGMVFLDDDPTGVSLQEWVFFGVMIYAAISFVRAYVKMYRNDRNSAE